MLFFDLPLLGSSARFVQSLQEIFLNFLVKN